MDFVDVPAQPRETTILELREFSRRLVRELGFMRTTLADSDLAPSAVYAIIEIGAQPGINARALGDILRLDKSNT
ncbi:MarR family transcriptional regulator, partial [Paraburkholderia sp. BR14261]